MEIEFEKNRINIIAKNDREVDILLQLGGILDELKHTLDIEVDFCGSDNVPKLIGEINCEKPQQALNILLKKLCACGLIKTHLEAEYTDGKLYLKEI